MIEVNETELQHLYATADAHIALCQAILSWDSEKDAEQRVLKLSRILRLAREGIKNDR